MCPKPCRPSHAPDPAHLAALPAEWPFWLWPLRLPPPVAAKLTVGFLVVSRGARRADCPLLGVSSSMRMWAERPRTVGMSIIAVPPRAGTDRESRMRAWMAPEGGRRGQKGGGKGVMKGGRLDGTWLAFTEVLMRGEPASQALNQCGWPFGR